jgi:uncharacterized protein (TIGR00251 family)
VSDSGADPITTIENGVRIRVHAQPGGSRTQVVGLHGDSVKIKIAAPPEDGRANYELCAFLAELFGVAKSAVKLVVGPASRAKVVEIVGVTREIAVNKLIFVGKLK